MNLASSFDAYRRIVVTGFVFVGMIGGPSGVTAQEAPPSGIDMLQGFSVAMAKGFSLQFSARAAEYEVFDPEPCSWNDEYAADGAYQLDICYVDSDNGTELLSEGPLPIVPFRRHEFSQVTDSTLLTWVDASGHEIDDGLWVYPFPADGLDRDTYSDWSSRIGEPLVCDEDWCHVILLRTPPTDRPAEEGLLLCSIPRWGDGLAAPDTCEVIAVRDSTSTYLRAYAGLGSSETASKLGVTRDSDATRTSPVEIVMQARVYSTSLSRRELVAVIAGALSSAPLKLSVQQKPVDDPVRIEAHASFRDSPVLGKEWAEAVTVFSNVDGSSPDFDFDVHASLVVSRQKVSQSDARLPTPRETAEYHRVIQTSIRSAFEMACGRQWPPSSTNSFNCDGRESTKQRR